MKPDPRKRARQREGGSEGASESEKARERERERDRERARARESERARDIKSAAMGESSETRPVHADRVRLCVYPGISGMQSFSKPKKRGTDSQVPLAHVAIKNDDIVTTLNHDRSLPDA